MSLNTYHFVTRWTIRGTCQEVTDILRDARELPRWWPSVYLQVDELASGDAVTGVGKRVSLFTKGWLPYTLRWSFTVTEARHPHGFSLVAEGDFVGRGIWTLEQRGELADVVYDWAIEADKPLLRYLSPIMKPIFRANHVWAMARGEESLKLELARRRAGSEEERRLLPDPPGPTFRHKRRGS